MEIVFAQECEDHLKALTARQRSMVLDKIDKQLTQQPDAETRNRKPMCANPVASWEFRIGNLRVYYDIIEASEDEQTEPTVNILAVGVKRHNRVWIGGREIEL